MIVPECFKRGELNKREIYALQRLEQGQAGPEEQRLALQGFLKVTRVYDQHYIPDSERDTTFLLGRAYAGQQIIKCLRFTSDLLNKLEE